MSFLVAINGQFSPIGHPVDKVPLGVPSVNSIYPSTDNGVREFKDVLHSLKDGPHPKPIPKVEAYQKHAKSYEQEKKREHAKDIMSSPVKVISESTLASEAIEIMHKFGFRHLPVVNEQNGLVGMISDRELMNAGENKRCSDIMILRVIVSDELTSINEIAITLLNEKINALPIINRKNELTGIITFTDILGYVVKSTAFLSSG